MTVSNDLPVEFPRNHIDEALRQLAALREDLQKHFPNSAALRGRCSSIRSSLEGTAPAKGDETNHPDHYNQGDMETIEAIEGLGYGPGFCIGNAIKYLSRFQGKDGVRDLKKAAWYVHRLIKRIDASQLRPLIVSMLVNEFPGLTADQIERHLQALEDCQTNPATDARSEGDVGMPGMYDYAENQAKT